MKYLLTILLTLTIWSQCCLADKISVKEFCAEFPPIDPIDMRIQCSKGMIFIEHSMNYSAALKLITSVDKDILYFCDYVLTIQIEGWEFEIYSANWGHGKLAARCVTEPRINIRVRGDDYMLPFIWHEKLLRKIVETGD